MKESITIQDLISFIKREMNFSPPYVLFEAVESPEAPITALFSQKDNYDTPVSVLRNGKPHDWEKGVELPTYFEFDPPSLREWEEMEKDKNPFGEIFIIGRPYIPKGIHFAPPKIRIQIKKEKDMWIITIATSGKVYQSYYSSLLRRSNDELVLKNYYYRLYCGDEKIIEKVDKKDISILLKAMKEEVEVE